MGPCNSKSKKSDAQKAKGNYSLGLLDSFQKKETLLPNDSKNRIEFQKPDKEPPKDDTQVTKVIKPPPKPPFDPTSKSEIIKQVNKDSNLSKNLKIDTKTKHDFNVENPEIIEIALLEILIQKIHVLPDKFDAKDTLDYKITFMGFQNKIF